MPSQQKIHAFTKAFHRTAIERLNESPDLVERALQTIARWQTQRGPSASDLYMHEWQALLKGDLSQLQTRVCAGDDHAATLRNTSPLGFVLTPAERHALRGESMRRAA
ncbi:MAG: hypothetical protein H7197_06000 [Vitreoscilla sp.]|nr:hypothetical protein [Polaromonas sp.]